MEPGAAQVHHQLAVLVAHLQITQIETEQTEEADEVGLHVGDALEVGQLLGCHLQLGKRLDLLADLVEVGRQVLTGAAAECPLHLRVRIVMQHRLHHGELVEIGIQQALDDSFGKGAAVHRPLQLEMPVDDIDKRQGMQVIVIS